MDFTTLTLPQPLSPRQMLLAEVTGRLSLWQHGRDHPVIGPVTARDLLAHWGGLRRLGGDPLHDDRAARLDHLVRSAVTELGERMLTLAKGFASAWRRRAEELSQAWDGASPADHDDIAWSAQLLFEDLDRLQLAVWTLGELLPADSPIRSVLEQFSAETSEAERFLIERPDLFIDRVEELGEVLSAARPNLEDDCPGLWETLLKHRRIEEEQESVEMRPAPFHLLAAAVRCKRDPARVVTDYKPDVGYASEPQLALAAGPTNGVPFLHQLATATAAVRPGDYRRAWAHFLACCYAETSRAADWLGLFLNATAAAGTALSGDWQERVQRVQRLSQQRDWEDCYKGTQVFRLEPRPLGTPDDLVRWLHELVELSSSS